MLRFRDLHLISSVSLSIKIKSFYEVYPWNSPYLWATSGSHVGLSDSWKRLFSQAELRPAVLNQRRNSRPGYGKKELAYTPYNDGLIGLIRSVE